MLPKLRSALPGSRTVLLGLVLLAAAGIPLLFSPRHYLAFELPKAMAARWLGGLSVLLLLGTGRGALQERSPAIAALLFAGVVVAATAFSVDPRLSLWGAYERQFGLLTWLALIGLFLAALAVLHRPDRRRLLWRVLIWGSGPVIAYGLIQALGADPFAWNSDGRSPILSTMGRSNFLGGYLILIIPLTVAEVAQRRRRPALLLLAGQVLLLALSGARAAWLGLLAATLAAGFLWLVAGDRQRGARRLLLPALALGGGLLVLALATGLPGRLATAGSPAARLTIWRTTLPLLAARPWLGYGPDTLHLPFQGAFPPELVYYQGRHLAVDRAHNLWIDLGMSAGLLGIGAFALLLLVVARRLWRQLTGHGGRPPAEQVAIATALIGHLAALQASFDTVGTAVIFWILLAAGAAPGNGDPTRASGSRRWPSPALSDIGRGQKLLVALPLLCLLAVVSVRPLLADAAYWHGLRAAPGSPEAQERLGAAAGYWPLEPRYHLALAQAYYAGGRPEKGAGAAAAALRLQGADAQLWAAAGALYAHQGATGSALDACLRAVDLAPNVAAYHTALGLLLAEEGRPAAGIGALERAVTLDATDVAAYTHLARLYRAAGREEAAARAAGRAAYWATGAD